MSGKSRTNASRAFVIRRNKWHNWVVFEETGLDASQVHLRAGVAQQERCPAGREKLINMSGRVGCNRATSTSPNIESPTVHDQCAGVDELCSGLVISATARFHAGETR